MNSTEKISVAFLFFPDGNEWQGGSNYFRALFTALEANPQCHLRVLAFIGKKPDTHNFKFPSSVTFIRTSALDRDSLAWIFDRICQRLFGIIPLLWLAMKRAKVQVVSHCDPRFSRVTKGFLSIAWIPDFQHMHLPHFFKHGDIIRRNTNYKMTLDCADLVIVSSHAAHEDLKKFSRENSNKVRVLQFCAIPPELAEDGEDVVKLYELADPYFYFPGQFWAHKNHLLVIDALVKVRERWPKVQIVCSGALTDYRDPEHIKTLQEKISKLALSDSLKIIGMIPYQHIPQLMVRSAAVINPSFFEGWSTTVEEAKSLGAPLLLSDLAVHREQCPNGEALFFAPDDSAGLAHCLERVLSRDWPIAVPDRDAALNKYKERVMLFARKYQAIADELV